MVAGGGRGAGLGGEGKEARREEERKVKDERK